MSEQAPDDRLIYGAVIAAELGFELGELAGATTFGRDLAPEPGTISLRFDARPLRDLALESPIKVLSGLTGVLRISSERERMGRLGHLQRTSDGYEIAIFLFQAELDRYLKLISSGLRPSLLRLEFDIEVHQWVEVGDYWDDVRYPYVQMHEHWIEWTR